MDFVSNYKLNSFKWGFKLNLKGQHETGFAKNIVVNL